MSSADDGAMGEELSGESPGDAELVSMRNVLIGASVVFWGYVLAYSGFTWVPLFTEPPGILGFLPLVESTGDTAPRGQYGVVFLGFILVLYVWTELMALAGGGRGHLVADLERAYSRENLLDAVPLTLAAGITVAMTGYLALNYQAVAIDRAGRALPHEYYLAGAFVVTMIYLTWRSFGLTFLIVLLAGFGYGYFGTYAPGPLQHGGLSVERILRTTAIGDDGFFGFLTKLVAAWIALFLLYAGFLKAYGAFDLIMRLAFRSARYIDSGVAQTAVLSSAVIGSVNGSQTANAGMTGSFTIPLMKRNGITPGTSGAIEAVASTSGQVLPPVMGAGAFIMASLILGVTYVDVIIAGLIPAAVLSLTIFVAVHYVSVPQLDAADAETLIQEPMPRSEFLTECVKYGLPLAVLIYLLGIVQVTVMTAALWTAITMFLTGTLIPLGQAAIDVTEETPVESLKRTTWETLDGGREGVAVLAPVAIILAAINGVVDILTTTGVPGAISLTLLDLSGGVLLYAAILSMIICIFLGLGMPTTASYTIVALLIAPTLINQFFLPELAAHFFVFYAAILAGLTPPIATCVAVACGIAGGNFWRTCLEAIKISAPLFVLPFAFVYHPEIVSAEFNAVTLTSGVLALLGSMAIIHGINYRFVFDRPVTLGARVAFFGTGLVGMLHPSRTVQFGAIGAALAMYLVQTFVGRPDPVRALRGVVGASGRSPEPGDPEPSDPDRTR